MSHNQKPSPTRYECEVCGVGVTLYVTPTEPPSHECKKQRSQPKPLKPKP